MGNIAAVEPRTEPLQLGEAPSPAKPEKSQRAPRPSDRDLIRAAEQHYAEDRLLAAARLLRRVHDGSLLKEDHTKLLAKAGECEAFVRQLKSSVEDGGEWTKQGESHGRHNSLIYYKMGGEHMSHLNVRVETPIPSSLLIPLLSVLNECELYQTWLPSWEKPVRLGVTKSEKLRQVSRVSQVLAVETSSPWPLAPREVILGAVAWDDIDHCGDVAIHLKGLHTDNDEMGVEIPPPQGGSVRVDFDGGFLFQKCPEDHPALDREKREKSSTENKGEDREQILLVSFLMYVDSKMKLLPVRVINFVVRTVIGRMWEKFLSVAEDVKEGKRPHHKEAIEAKRECLYNWVDERIDAMFKRLENSGSGSTAEESQSESLDTSEHYREYVGYLQC